MCEVSLFILISLPCVWEGGLNAKMLLMRFYIKYDITVFGPDYTA